MDNRQVHNPYESFCNEGALMASDLIAERLGDKSMSAYGLAIAECNYIDERLRDTVKELSKLKFALDEAAIVAITDCRGIIRYVNDTFCEISQYNREELLGKDHRIINSGYHPKEFFKGIWSTIKSGKVWKGEIRNKAKDGTYYWVDTTIVPFADEQGRPYQYLSIRFDISDRKNAEEALRQSEANSRQQAQKLEIALQHLKLTQSQLVQSEKLSSMGQMVAGIAHEINNPVNFIHGNLNHTDDYIQTLLQLLRLYRQHYPHPMSEIQTIAEDSDVDFLMEDLPKMLNSITSSPEAVLISIADNGSGIPEDVQKRLSEPFFTTKSVGQGTGLGLSIARHILVDKHKGQLQCISQPNQGTQFLISIPISPQL